MSAEALGRIEPSQRRRRKASKGTVQVKNSNGRLQLVFTFEGKRRYLSLGFQDAPETRELAQMRANQIRLDLISGNFDETLAKYKPESTAKGEGTEKNLQTPALPTLNALWEQFLEGPGPIPLIISLN